MGVEFENCARCKKLRFSRQNFAAGDLCNFCREIVGLNRFDILDGFRAAHVLSCQEEPPACARTGSPGTLSVCLTNLTLSRIFVPQSLLFFP
jgi:hypothetical protein